MIDWRAAVRRKAEQSGLDLPAATVDELSQHLEDLSAAARQAGEDAAAAHEKATAALERSAFELLRS